MTAMVALKRWILMAGVAGAPLLSGQIPDEGAALRRELGELKKEVGIIRSQLEQVLKLLEAKGTAPSQFAPSELQVSGFPTRGSDRAKVTLVEFTDYECPYCGRYFNQVYPRLINDFVKTNKLRYVAREFPLVTTHKSASKAAEIVLCAGDQDKYWEMREQFFKNQKALQSNDLSSLVRQAGLKHDELQKCLDSGKYTERVNSDMEEGRKAGVRGTPTFFFGLTEPGSRKITATKVLKGAVPYEQFEAIIETLQK